MINNKKFINKTFDNTNQIRLQNNLKTYAPKFLNLIIINNIFVLIMIISLCIFFSDPHFLYRNDVISNQYRQFIFTYQQTAIAIVLYVLAWYIMVNFFFFGYLLEYVKLNKFETFNFALASILFNPYAYVIIVKNWTSWSFYWQRSFYHVLSENNKIEFNIKNSKTIFALVFLIIAIPFIIFSSIDYVPKNPGRLIIFNKNSLGEKVIYTNNVWFHNMHYFTSQGNWMCIGIAFLYFINPKARCTKNNRVLLIVLSYILIISSIWLCVLFPMFSRQSTWVWFNNMVGFYNHLITPTSFTIFAYYCIIKNKYAIHIKYFYAWKGFMFYVVIYAMYALFLPLLANVTVYGAITNIWPSANGNPIFVTMLFALIGYQILVFSINWTILKFINKYKNNKILIG
ncbi:DUF1600 domain-containing protein [Ureaplasma parvum]|uniref:DUF1600 domain-containing protein n=1 Tax=Ureaplasma parvum TaxID=134821 RepID=UPI00307D0607